jgi:hypothetical protein
MARSPSSARAHRPLRRPDLLGLADFAIPFLDEDIPLYLDPFLLWRSPSQQDNALHTALLNSFNHLGYLEKQGKRREAIHILTTISECDEVGFGHSQTRVGRRIGQGTAEEILDLFRSLPDYDRRSFRKILSSERDGSLAGHDGATSVGVLVRFAAPRYPDRLRFQSPYSVVE